MTGKATEGMGWGWLSGTQLQAWPSQWNPMPQGKAGGQGVGLESDTNRTVGTETEGLACGLRLPLRKSSKNAARTKTAITAEKCFMGTPFRPGGPRVGIPRPMAFLIR